jgi:hypothetical protein
MERNIWVNKEFMGSFDFSSRPKGESPNDFVRRMWPASSSGRNLLPDDKIVVGKPGSKMERSYPGLQPVR